MARRTPHQKIQHLGHEETTRKRIIKPYCSSGENVAEFRRQDGEEEFSSRPMGARMRLKNANARLIYRNWIRGWPATENWRCPGTGSSYRPDRHGKKTAAIAAITRFDNGPAIAPIAIEVRGLPRMFMGLTMTGGPTRIRRLSSMIVPNGSRCLSGFRVCAPYGAAWGRQIIGRHGMGQLVDRECNKQNMIRAMMV